MYKDQKDLPDQLLRVRIMCDIRMLGRTTRVPVNHVRTVMRGSHAESSPHSKSLYEFSSLQIRLFIAADLRTFFFFFIFHTL